MSRFAQLLWAIGSDLREPVREAFTALKFDTELVETPQPAVAVRLDGQRRLLLHVSSVEGPIDKKSAEIEQAFRLLHQVAGERDRVVLVVNNDRMHPPASRPESITPDAMRLLQRMGINCVAAPTLFRLWTVASHNVDRARKFVNQLHEQDGGTVTLSA
jgi:hypothetical protein